MADNNLGTTPARVPLGQVTHGAPDTQIGRQSSLSMDVGTPGVAKEQRRVQREPDQGLSITVDGKNSTMEHANQQGAATGQTPADGEQPSKADEAGQQPTQGDSPLAALPVEFDPEKPDTVAAYDAAFTTEDGKFNMANLSADWQRNAKQDPKTGESTGELSPATYAYLESRGIDRETVKAVEAGQVAKMSLERNEVYSRAGGAEKYNAAIAWARDGGYDKSAADKFNLDLNAGGAARADAVDLLMQRFNKAAPPQRRAAAPKRSMADAAVQAGGVGGPAPYANHAAWQADVRKARATGDQALLNEARARLKVSPWYGGSR